MNERSHRHHGDVPADDLRARGRGRDTVAVYVLAVFAMLLLSAVSNASFDRANNVNRVVLASFVLAAVVLNVAYCPYIRQTAVDICSRILDLPNTLFSWWRVIIGLIELLFLTVVMSNIDEDGKGSLGPDSSFALMSALGLLILRLLLS